MEVYSMRAKHKGRAFKMVRGEIKGLSEARGEDTFDNRFDAIYHFTQAIRAWRFAPQGLTYDLNIAEGEPSVGSN